MRDIIKIYFLIFAFFLTAPAITLSQTAITFQEFPSTSIKVGEDITIDASVNSDVVNMYRFKLVAPPSWQGDLPYTVNNFGDWDNDSELYARYKVKVAGDYQFVIQYKTWDGQTIELSKDIIVGYTRNNNHYATNNEYDISSLIEDYNFPGKGLKLSGVAGMHNAEHFYARTFTNSDALLNFNIREREYKNVLRALAFQEEFASFDLINKIKDSQGINPEDLANEVFAIIAPLESSAGIIDGLTNKGFLNLRYIKNVDNYSMSINKFKNLGRNIRHSNLGSALTALSLAEDILSIKEVGMRMYVATTLLNAASYDMGLKRLQYLKSLYIINDYAYTQALNAVIKELSNIPETYWDKLAEVAKLHKREIIEGTFSVVDAAGIAMNALKIIGSKANLWMGSVLFTIKVYNGIQDWKSDLRQSALAATIFTNLSKTDFDKENNYYCDLNEYSQYLFNKKMVSVLNIGWLKVWELLRRGQQEVRLLFERNKTGLTNFIINRRINNILSNKKIANLKNVRIVLKWGAFPRDLDAHFVKENGYHISYKKKHFNVDGSATLDHDDRDGYGPETITINNIDTNATYLFFVRDYSDRRNSNSNALARSGATVKVYTTTTDIPIVYNVPLDLNGNIWKVFKIVNGVIVNK
jgi:hypothetical protein